jgi:hypothetical protein
VSRGLGDCIRDRGNNGLNGLDGVQGAKGDKGDNGQNGVNGHDGAQGAKGDAGANGANGANGAQGPQGPQGATGAQGAQGPKGDQGAQGQKGDPGTASLTQITKSANGTGTFSAQAVCATGYVATGGGFEVGGSDSTKIAVIISKPIVVASGADAGKAAWLVTANYIGSGSQNGYTLTAYVLCAPTS